MRKLGLHIILLLLATNLMAQGDRMLTESKGNTIKLRWNGVHDRTIKGYFVYRKKLDESDWKKLNTKPQKYYWKRTELKKILGYKTTAYLQLFGYREKDTGYLDATAWDSTFSKEGADAFMGAMSLINPEYGIALGEVYYDSAIDRSATYLYKVTLLDRFDVEKDIAFSDPVTLSKITIVPSVNDPVATAGDGKVLLQWKKEKEWLQKGTVVTYKVYQSNDLLGPFEPLNYFGILSVSVSSGNGPNPNANIETYMANYLQNGKTYYFKIKAVNAFGTESDYAVTLSATPSDPNTLSPPRNIKIDRLGSKIKITLQEKKQVSIYRRETARGSFKMVYPPAKTAMPPLNMWYDNDVKEGSEYWYVLKTTDGVNEGPTGDTLHFLLTDNKAPLPPKNVKTSSKKGLITISWDANKETDILGYNIERASDKQGYTRFLLNKKPIAGTTYNDSLDFRSQTVFRYVVYAVDKSYNRSKPSEMAWAKLPDFDPPAKPLIMNLYENDSGVMMRWEGPPDKDVAQYRIYRKPKGNPNWEKKGETTKLFYTDKPTTGIYEYAITAIDSAKNESPFSITQSIDVKADKSLLVPIDGKSEIKDGSVNISWKPAVSSTPVKWVVTRIIGEKRIDVAELNAQITTYSDNYPIAGKIRYEVRAANANMQMGIPLVIEIDYKP